jgi:hypothetical protein
MEALFSIEVVFLVNQYVMYGLLGPSNGAAQTNPGLGHCSCVLTVLHGIVHVPLG